MNEAREKHLIEQVSTLGCLDEALGFRKEITDHETMGAGLFKALTARIDYLAKKEGRR